MLKDELEYLAKNYVSEKSREFAGNPLAQRVRRDIPIAVKSAINPEFSSVFVKGSCGQGQWAAVPWIAIFDPVVTRKATAGHYAVYLFREDMTGFYLSINQGTTSVREEFGAGTHEELLRRSDTMFARLGASSDGLNLASINLKSSSSLAKDYEAGHVIGRFYSIEDIPSSDQLQADLNNLLAHYFSLTAKGGIDNIDELDLDDLPSRTLIERRRYKLHRRIERNDALRQAAKRIHGDTCQACDLNFSERYGAIGEGYIEAHHKTPLAHLPENREVAQDPRTDFAVLCSNCHRMIHRLDDPSNIAFLRSLISTANN